jgi:effector-binding domain-containing protein
MASDIEEPEWALVDNLGEVEIRAYEPSIQAVTELPSSRATSAGFRRLAGYIFGGNEQGQSIAMTAPVQETLGQERPVMAFTMPSEYSLEELPSPGDERVKLVSVPGRTVAAVSFSGWATGARVERYKRNLLKTLNEFDVEATGTPVLNQYNPPWTPPFMRRNEISVEVEYLAVN